MSDTPRTDALKYEITNMAEWEFFARQLERELAAMTADRDSWRDQNEQRVQDCLRLGEELAALRAELAANAALLARQCDLAREAETKLGHAQEHAENLRHMLNLANREARAFKQSVSDMLADPVKLRANILRNGPSGYDLYSADHIERLKTEAENQI